MKKLAWLLISPLIATPLCAADLMQVYRDAQSNDPTFAAARAAPGLVVQAGVGQHQGHAPALASSNQIRPDLRLHQHANGGAKLPQKARHGAGRVPGQPYLHIARLQ